MKHVVRNALLAALGVLFVSSTAFAAFSPLKLDRTHSKMSFTAATVIFDVDGEFGEFDVQIDGERGRLTLRPKDTSGR